MNIKDGNCNKDQAKLSISGSDRQHELHLQCEEFVEAS